MGAGEGVNDEYVYCIYRCLWIDEEEATHPRPQEHQATAQHDGGSETKGLGGMCIILLYIYCPF